MYCNRWFVQKFVYLYKPFSLYSRIQCIFVPINFIRILNVYYVFFKQYIGSHLIWFDFILVSFKLKCVCVRACVCMQWKIIDKYGSLSLYCIVLYWTFVITNFCKMHTYLWLHGNANLSNIIRYDNDHFVSACHSCISREYKSNKCN